MDLPFTSSKKKLYISQKNMTRDFHSWNIFFSFLFSMHTGQTHSMYMKQEILIYGRSYNNNSKDSQHIRPNFISILFFVYTLLPSFVQANNLFFRLCAMDAKKQPWTVCAAYCSMRKRKSNKQQQQTVITILIIMCNCI